MIGVMACVMMLGFVAAGLAHKSHPAKGVQALRCPLVDGRGGSFDTAKTDALMKASQCWLTI
jgi:hypothetical protein